MCTRTIKRSPPSTELERPPVSSKGTPTPLYAFHTYVGPVPCAGTTWPHVAFGPPTRSRHVRAHALFTLSSHTHHTHAHILTQSLPHHHHHHHCAHTHTLTHTWHCAFERANIHPPVCNFFLLSLMQGTFLEPPRTHTHKKKPTPSAFCVRQTIGQRTHAARARQRPHACLRMIRPPSPGPPLHGAAPSVDALSNNTTGRNFLTRAAAARHRPPPATPHKRILHRERERERCEVMWIERARCARAAPSSLAPTRSRTRRQSIYRAFLLRRLLLCLPLSERTCLAVPTRWTLPFGISSRPSLPPDDLRTLCRTVPPSALCLFVCSPFFSHHFSVRRAPLTHLPLRSPRASQNPPT